MERLIIVNRIDDAPVNSRQWIEPAISKKMTMMVTMILVMVAITIRMTMTMKMMLR